MATAAKKKSVKRAVKARKPRPTAKVTNTAHHAEVFSTEQEQPERIRVAKGKVQLFVRGSDYGQVDVNGQKLADFAVAQARSAGIRTFSVYADGEKVEPGSKQANSKADAFAKIEIVPKDSRG